MIQISGVKVLVGAAMVCLCAGALAQANSNPFKKGATATATAATTAGKPASQTSALPPPLLDAAKNGLPPVVPPMGAQMGTLTEARNPSPKLLGADEAAPAPQDKGGPFMTREAIETLRANCHSSLVGPTLRVTPSTEGESVVKLQKTAGQHCLVAVSVDVPWADAQMDVSNDEVRVIFEENPLASSRSAWLQVVTGLQTFKVKIRQEASRKPKAYPVEEVVENSASPALPAPVSPD